MSEKVLYTDGACLGNPGPGGWAYALIEDGEPRTRSGGAVETTNNRMELMGVINGLSEIPVGGKVTVYSDSQYVVNAFTQCWIAGWKRNGWTRSGGELANKELWQTLDLIVKKRTVKWVWVKGHAGNRYNELCDRLASEAAQRYATDGELAQMSFAGDCGDAEAGCEKFEVPSEEDLQVSMDNLETVRMRQELDAMTTQMNDTLLVLDLSLVHSNVVKYDIEYPCGACPWCQFCDGQMPEDGRYNCARAYVRYHLAKLEAKKVA